MKIYGFCVSLWTHLFSSMYLYNPAKYAKSHFAHTYYIKEDDPT